MRKRVMTMAGLLAMIMVLTGCFAVRSWSWTDYKLNPGESAKIKTTLKPAFPSVHSTGYAVILVGYKDMVPKSYDLFDTKGNYGGPFEGIRSVSLENRMLSSCSAMGVTIENFEADQWVAFRSEEQVTAKGKKALVFRHRAGVANDETVTGGALLLVSGLWQDGDEDLIADAFEVTCSGFVIAPIQINQD